MLPTTKVAGFPPNGFRPATRHLVGGLHAQRSAGVNCSVRSGVLPAGIVSAEALAHGEALSRSSVARDGLAHTTLIPGDLERGCFVATKRGLEGQRHRPRVAARCRDSLSRAGLQRPLHPDTFGLDAVIQITIPPNKSMSAPNTGYGSPYPHHRGRRDLRPAESGQRRAWRDVGRTGMRPVGNPAGRGLTQPEASDALAPTAKAMRFRTVPL